MPSKIDQNLLPPVIRESVDPEILARAQSIEWTINRDTGEDEHGYVDGSHEDYLSAQNLLPKTHGMLSSGNTSTGRKSRKIEWLDEQNGRDSGYDATPTSPSLGNKLRSTSSLTYSNNQSTLDDPALDFAATGQTNATGPMKSFPRGQYPFPIYNVNRAQLEGDVVFEPAPRAKPGERTVHYEKSSRILNEEELEAMGLNPKVFGPNSRTTMDEQEEEMIQTSIIKGGSRELEDFYNQHIRNDSDEYFERQRARSVSPTGNRNPIESSSSEHKKTIVFGSIDEIDNREQEFYPYRDAHQGKPLPGDNEYGTWGSRYDEQRQWKLCNGQWVRVGEPKKPKEPKYEKFMAEKVKCKPQIARAEPVRPQVKPQSGSTDTDLEPDDDLLDLDNSLSPSLDEAPYRVVRAPSVDSSPSPSFSSRQPLRVRPQEPSVDLDALKDRYRPKVEASPKPEADDDDDKENDTKADPDHTGTILLEPIRPPTPPLEEIKVEPIQPTYVEMKKPLKQPDGEEEKMMEDPNLMWMHMGPAQYGPPFGTLKRRKAREEEWIGPPCELCHKQIEERRCMLAENMKFHCWHFACSFCLKTLKPADFLIAEADRKPYCLNCHKREFPEISLANLNLED